MKRSAAKVKPKRRAASKLSRRKRKPPKPAEAPPPKAVLALGPPPADPLEAEAWMHKMLIASLHDAAVDPSISSTVRRKEMRTISAAAAKLMPRARLWEAEQLIKRDRKELEELKTRRGAKLEARPPRPPATGAP